MELCCIIEVKQKAPSAKCYPVPISTNILLVHSTWKYIQYAYILFMKYEVLSKKLPMCSVLYFFPCFLLPHFLSSPPFTLSFFPHTKRTGCFGFLATTEEDGCWSGTHSDVGSLDGSERQGLFGGRWIQQGKHKHTHTHLHSLSNLCIELTKYFYIYLSIIHSHRASCTRASTT